MTFSRIVALCALVSLSPGCKKGPATTPPPAATTRQVVKFDPAVLERLGVKSEAAGSDAPLHQLHLIGSLEYAPDGYAEVGVLVEGRVTSLLAKVGDPVKKGQPVATVLVPAMVSAQAEAVSAQAALQVARENVKREAALYDKQLTTAREYELAKGEAIKAEAQLAAANSKLRLLGSGLPAPNGTVTLVSPIDGVVVRRDAVLGAFLQPNENAFAVGDASTVWALLDVFEADLPYVMVGADVTLRADALPGKTFPGKIASLEPQVGRATRTMHARVVIDNREGGLRPGYFVRASVPIPSKTPSGHLLLPAAAVQPLADRDVVFVEKEPGHYEVRIVTVERRTSQIAEVSDGLMRGELIAVHGAFLLRGEVAKQ